MQANIDALTAKMGESRFLAYHAGLESGIVIDRGEGELSTVAIGPLIVDAHTYIGDKSVDALIATFTP